MILAWYSTLLVRHFSLSGHWRFLIQLHVLAILSFWALIFFVMRINYLFHVGHETVAYFNVVFIEQFTFLLCRLVSLFLLLIDFWYVNRFLLR